MSNDSVSTWIVKRQVILKYAHMHTIRTLWLPCRAVHWQGLRKLQISQWQLLAHVGHTVTKFVFQSVSRSPLLWHFVNVCKLTGTGGHTCVGNTLPTHALSALPPGWQRPQKLHCAQMFLLCLCRLGNKLWMDSSSTSPLRSTPGNLADEFSCGTGLHHTWERLVHWGKTEGQRESTRFWNWRWRSQHHPLSPLSLKALEMHAGGATVSVIQPVSSPLASMCFLCNQCGYSLAAPHTSAILGNISSRKQR